MGTYKDLLVWQKSMELVKAVYQLTADFPMEELMNLTSVQEIIDRIERLKNETAA